MSNNGLFAFGLLGLLFPGFLGPLAWAHGWREATVRSHRLRLLPCQCLHADTHKDPPRLHYD